MVIVFDSMDRIRKQPLWILGGLVLFILLVILMLNLSCGSCLEYGLPTMMSRETYVGTLPFAVTPASQYTEP